MENGGNMNREESIVFAQKFLEDILSFFGVNLAVYSTADDEIIQLSVPSSELNSLLIGRDSGNLRSLQFLISRALEAKNAEIHRVNIDVADYKKQRAQKITEKAEIELDDKRQFVTIVGEAPARMMFFEKIGTKVKDNMFKLTYDSFIKGIKTYDELIERIEKFKENIDNKKFTPNWEDFFENLEKKFNSVKIEDDYIVLKLKNNKELIQTVIRDKRFKNLALKGEEYHLLVKRENLKELIKIFSEYGYYIVE